MGSHVRRALQRHDVSMRCITALGGRSSPFMIFHLVWFPPPPPSYPRKIKDTRRGSERLVAKGPACCYFGFEKTKHSKQPLLLLVRLLLTSRYLYDDHRNQQPLLLLPPSRPLFFSFA